MKLRKKFTTIAIFLLPLTPLQMLAQDSTQKQNPLTISGYAEIYYSYDFNKPQNHTRPAFIYSHNRANEVALNLGFIKANYVTENVRANLALATGSYMNANYSAEPGVLKNIYEANIGIKISKKENLWIDAGIMPSHIGFESAIGKDNPTLTRSLAAENSPYFETGVKLGYTTKNEKWYIAALYLNGWQRIQRIDGNSTPAFGTQITYKPSAKLTVNYSTFAGNDKPDSIKKMRYFHNLYGIYQLNDHWAINAGIDYGIEQKQKGSREFNNWYVPVLLIRYTPDDRWGFTARTEYYRDKSEIIIATGTANGFNTFGVSFNMDRMIGNNVWWRTEVRTLKGKDAIFQKKNNNLTDNNTSITTSLSISF